MGWVFLTNVYSSLFALRPHYITCYNESVFIQASNVFKLISTMSLRYCGGSGGLCRAAIPGSLSMRGIRIN